MEATAVKNKPTGLPNPAKKSRRISWDIFQRDYLTREDGYKYEWLDGRIEKTKRTINQSQFFLLANLQDFFFMLKHQGKVNGQLIPEGDIFFLKNHRRPDICWVSAAQLLSTAEGNNEVPQFIIEVTSTNDQANRVYQKMQNYRDAGVKVVWHIYPDLKEVHVFSGKELDEMTVCSGEKICSAEPALPAFKMSVADIFKKPVVAEKK